MARRSGGTHKGVEEKRRSLPIYQHYTLSPGKTKSHHPEAKCNHCLKEFVCGSKQRLIRHLRKCNSITNPEQIIAETLNTLARNSATGQLNHSILEASNLLPSQLSSTHNHHHQQLVSQHHHHQHHSSPSSSTTLTTATSNMTNNNNVSNHNTSGSSSNDTGLTACNTSNGSHATSSLASIVPNSPIKRPQRRGRKPANQSLASPTIHVTTGVDGKTHFTPASQLPSTISGTVAAPLITQVHNGRQVGYTFHPGAVSTTGTGVVPSGTHLAANSGHLACATPNHSTPFKLNSDHIDKAYLKLVLTRNLPISLCDTKEFHLWLKTFANDYKPPSSISLIAQNLKQEAQAAKQRISNILVKAPKKTVNLELHYWPDELQEHSWCAIIANLEHKRFLVAVRDLYTQSHPRQNLQINTSNNHKQSNDSGIDKMLSEFIDDCIKRVGSDRINSLVSVKDLTSTRARKLLYTTHPSIVTYHCWWHFTNSLCSDIIEYNELFPNVMRNSNRLIDLINKQPKLGLNMEKFCPFGSVSSTISPQKKDARWYSHLVCYLLEYIKNNNEAITRALQAYSNSSLQPPSQQSHLSSDNNNNSSPGTSNSTQVGNHQQQAANTSTHQQTILCLDDSNGANPLDISSDYWTNLDSMLAYLKPIQQIVASTTVNPPAQQNLTNSGISVNNNTNSNSSNNNNSCTNTSSTSLANHPHAKQITPSVSASITNGLLLSDYMEWFLKYGKTVIENWRQAPDMYRYRLVGSYLSRFSSAFSEFKLLFASYLLNPKYRCAYMTQKAKNVAIEEILNIASEFMPEESDGHTIFDQWKLYLIREEPYDMVYEESRSTPLEWWMSLPCAESIRRVAIRILRLKAFTSPKPETLFSQLYFYEDETKASLNSGTFEDLAVLRYFYDYEDKIGQNFSQGTSHNHHSTPINSNASNALSSNGFHDRAQVGHIHMDHLHQSNNSTKYLPSGAIESEGGSTKEINGTSLTSLNQGQHSFSNSYSDDVVVESYMNHNSHMDMNAQANNLTGSTTNSSIEDLFGYDIFSQYIDYNETGVQIVDEPIEKKKRKWTAQEILSKCQSNHQPNNNGDINSK